VVLDQWPSMYGIVGKEECVDDQSNTAISDVNQICSAVVKL